MKKSIQYIAILFTAVAFSACETAIDEPTYSAGPVDFSRYVALGNSLTAGYQDGALNLAGQTNAYPAMLAQQFKMVGGAATFNTPFLTGDNGTYGVSPAPSLALTATTPALVLAIKNDCLGVSGLSPTLSAAPNLNNVPFYTPIFNGTYYQNMGVPGVKSFDLLRHSLGVFGTTMNPYYYRFASDNTPAGTSTVVSDALQSNPTFFTLWIGNNDVLGYATSGGSGIVGGTNPNDITPVAVFDSSIVNIVKAMTANGAKGVIGNIPNVTNIPYFTTVPYNGLALSNATQVDQLNAGYAVYNMGAKSLGLDTIAFALGSNAFIIQDLSPQYAPLGGLRQINAGEFITLNVPQDSIKCAGWGSQKPIPAQYVLDANEVNNVATYTASYNSYIKTVATQYNLAFADFNSFFKTFQTGIEFNGVTFTPTYVTGGAFSLDGVHPNKRGYALIANYYINTINTFYGSNIQQLDVNSYPGLTIP
jgi:lysophospholipase L1-like esterase